MKQTDPFYLSPAWRALRAKVLIRDNHRCVACGCDVSAPGRARVDHIKPRRTHPHLALDITNCRTFCARCDNQSHREKGSGGGDRHERIVIQGCDVTGRPLDPNHPWNKR